MTPISNLEKIADDIEADHFCFQSLAARLKSCNELIVSSHAYEHPYGFTVFNISALGDDVLVRLHVWPENRETIEDYIIHDHIYDITSVILCGSLTQTIFDRISDANPTHDLFIGTYGQDSSTISRSQFSARLTANNVECFTQQDRYSLAAGRLHSVQVPCELTATILVTRRSNSRSEPSIFGPRTGSDQITFYRRPVSQDEKRSLIKRVFDQISSQPAEWRHG